MAAAARTGRVGRGDSRANLFPTRATVKSSLTMFLKLLWTNFSLRISELNCFSAISEFCILRLLHYIEETMKTRLVKLLQGGGVVPLSTTSLCSPTPFGARQPFSCPTFFSCLSSFPWIPAEFFTGVGKLGVGTKVPQRGPGMEPRWRSVAKPPKADDRMWIDWLSKV